MKEKKRTILLSSLVEVKLFIYKEERNVPKKWVPTNPNIRSFDLLQGKERPTRGPKDLLRILVGIYRRFVTSGSTIDRTHSGTLSYGVGVGFLRLPLKGGDTKKRKEGRREEDAPLSRS